jgi:cytoskeleton protein RodZ
MIAIGNTLRDARKRRGLELSDCELETRIRARYLSALEDERFDVLPEPAYARGFLRNYATFLGLDARVLVEEFNDRNGTAPALGDVPPPPEPVQRRVPLPGAPVRRRRGWRHKGALVWLIAGAIGAVLLALWAGAAWTVRPSSAVVPTTSVPGATAPAVAPGAGVPAQSTPQVQLVGSPGTGSQVTIRAGGATGAVLYAGAIAPAAARQFPLSAGVWVSFDAVSGVQIFVNGKPVEIPGGIAQVTVGPDGTVRAG